MRGRIFWLAGLAIVAILIALWFLLRPAPAVQTLRPQRQTVRAYVDEEAVTALPRDTLIAMPLAGWLEPIDLREGDQVKAGQVVARLETADLRDEVKRIEHQIAELRARIAETADNRLEHNLLIHATATVEAIDDMVRAAEANLGATQAVADFAEAEVERLSNLFEAGSASEWELREARTEGRKAAAALTGDQLQLAAYKTIQAVSYLGPKIIRDYMDRKTLTIDIYQQQLEQVSAELEIARRNLERAEMRSPVDGVVLTRHETRRQYLAAGTPLLTIGRLEDLEIVVELLTEQAMRIDPDDPAEVYGDAVYERPRAARVSRIYPAGFEEISSLGVEQQRVKVILRLDERPPRLGVGFRVYARVYYDESPNALTVPRTAVFRSVDGAWRVMLIRDGRIELRDVTVGIMTDDLVEIREGLGEGDAVVANPSSDLSAGARARPSPAAGANSHP